MQWATAVPLPNRGEELFSQMGSVSSSVSARLGLMPVTTPTPMLFTLTRRWLKRKNLNCSISGKLFPHLPVHIHGCECSETEHGWNKWWLLGVSPQVPRSRRRTAAVPKDTIQNVPNIQVTDSILITNTPNNYILSILQCKSHPVPLPENSARGRCLWNSVAVVLRRPRQPN